jgi:hypothetical protein
MTATPETGLLSGDPVRNDNSFKNHVVALVFAILWLILLIFIAWPVANFCAWIWRFLQVGILQRRSRYRQRSVWSHVFAHFFDFLKRSLCTASTHSISLKQPFEALFDFVQSINQVMEQLTTWPRLCGHAIVNCQRTFPNPLSDAI